MFPDSFYWETVFITVAFITFSGVLRSESRNYKKYLCKMDVVVFGDLDVVRDVSAVGGVTFGFCVVTAEEVGIADVFGPTNGFAFGLTISSTLLERSKPIVSRKTVMILPILLV